MTIYTKFVATDINPARLMEDIANASLPQPGMLYAGFDSGKRIYTRFTETREIATVTDASGTTSFFADPGELRFTYDPDLSLSEQAALDAVLAAHDHLSLSVEQERQDKDVSVLVQVTNNLKKANWTVLTSSSKQETIRRALQLLFRNNNFRDLDTDD